MASVVSLTIESTVRAQIERRKAADAHAVQSLNKLVAGCTFLLEALEHAPVLWDLWWGCVHPLQLRLFVSFYLSTWIFVTELSCLCSLICHLCAYDPVRWKI